MRLLPLIVIGSVGAAVIATRRRRVQRRKDRRAARHTEAHKAAEGSQSV